MHSTFSTYSRGVSLLVYKSLQWEVGQVMKDTEGRFVFHAWIDSLPYWYIFTHTYTPSFPQADVSILHQVANFDAQFPTATLLCFGDLNLLINPVLDTFCELPGPLALPAPTVLSQFLE